MVNTRRFSDNLRSDSEALAGRFHDFCDDVGVKSKKKKTQR